MTEDKESGHFERHFKTMPWFAVPFEDEHHKQNLKQRFGIQEVPTLVVVSTETGRVVSHQAREEIYTCKDKEQDKVNEWKDNAKAPTDDQIAS